jgi:cohesin complex subunit SCC1
MQGKFAEQVFFPGGIHPELRVMFNPEYLRNMLKRKREEEEVPGTKRARVEIPAFEEQGFGDGGFADAGLDRGFGDTHQGGFGDNNDQGDFEDTLHDNTGFNPFRASTPRDDLPQIDEEPEVPTSLTGSLSRSTILAATSLQKYLSPSESAPLSEVTQRTCPGGVAREDAVKMFFEVLVLASRDLVKVEQRGGFGEILVRGKEGLFGGGFGALAVEIV